MNEKGLTAEERAGLVAQLERLREEHRDLDAAIEALRGAGQADQLQLQRLKKRKTAAPSYLPTATVSGRAR